MDIERPIYLASPYSHPDLLVMETRYLLVCRKAAEFINEGISVISPIAHNVSIITQTRQKNGWEYWKLQDEGLLKACQQLVVLRLPGWEESKGIQEEIRLATELGYPIGYIDYPTDIKIWLSNWQDN